jgi:hypothetical protein
MSVHELRSRERALTDRLQSGSFLVDLLHERLTESEMMHVISVYQTTVQSLTDTRDQLQACIDAEKDKFKATALEEYQTSGTTRVRGDGFRASVRVSSNYCPIEASAILQDHALYEQALNDGVVREERKIVKSKVKGKYAELLAPAVQERVSGVVVRIDEDEDGE